MASHTVRSNDPLAVAELAQRAVEVALLKIAVSQVTVRFGDIRVRPHGGVDLESLREMSGCALQGPSDQRDDTAGEQPPRPHLGIATIVADAQNLLCKRLSPGDVAPMNADVEGTR